MCGIGERIDWLLELKKKNNGIIRRKKSKYLVEMILVHPGPP